MNVQISHDPQNLTNISIHLLVCPGDASWADSSGWAPLSHPWRQLLHLLHQGSEFCPRLHITKENRGVITLEAMARNNLVLP